MPGRPSPSQSRPLKTTHSFKTSSQPATPPPSAARGQDVYDSTYRRAGALGPADFMTDFCPYETGILDIVTQLLLPPIVGDLETQAPISSEGGRNSDSRGRRTGNCTLHWRSRNRSLGSPDELLWTLSAELDVPFVDSDEAKDVQDRLDPGRRGVPVRRGRFRCRG